MQRANAIQQTLGLVTLAVGAGLQWGAVAGMITAGALLYLDVTAKDLLEVLRARKGGL